MKQRLVLFGTSSFGLPSFTALAEDPRFSLEAVVSQPARPVGRKQIVTDTPVSAWAKERDLRLVTPDSLKKPASRVSLEKIPADLYVVAAYGLILPTEVLAIPVGGAINIHASLLPKYRGASPIAAAIVNGDRETGLTYMVMDAGCDTGPMIEQLPMPLDLHDTKTTLEQRLSALAATKICDLVQRSIDGTATVTPQPHVGVTLAPKLDRADGHANWQDAWRIERMIRAFTPWPGVWAKWGQREIRLLGATAVVGAPKAAPGTVLATHRGWLVACTNGCLMPTLVQISGKRPQSAATLPGSYPGFIGTVLE